MALEDVNNSPDLLRGYNLNLAHKDDRVSKKGLSAIGNKLLFLVLNKIFNFIIYYLKN